MRILLTGASSFTGAWFADALARQGHMVVAPLRGAEAGYGGVRAARVNKLTEHARIVWSCPFGSEPFLALARDERFDILCHHAAWVTDYRSPDFDVARALSENTRELPRLLRDMRERGMQGLVLTGSVFESGEGTGSMPLRAFSPYGVSKGITAALVEYWCREHGIAFGKFVIPNPFGPYEEARFCAYLVNIWKAGKVAEVRTPLYVRDNIHVDLLAKAYAGFVASLDRVDKRANPSGYVESQGAFALRFAKEVGGRLGLPAEVRLLEQTDFSEPMVRINTEPVDAGQWGWSETAAWDRIAEYYAHGPGSGIG